MFNTIISDTSCLIILSNIGEIEILRSVFGSIVTTSEVADEFGQVLPEWIEIRSATDLYRQRILELQIDKGEASAIALAIEIPEAVLILDDYKARKIAESLGLEFVGTIGIIIKAKKLGIIKSIKPILNKIRQTNFRFSPELEKFALDAAGE
jgi:predicted nucleic acid-binding protein